MSFHKRHLSMESMKRYAKSAGFKSFQTYVTNADAYIFTGDEQERAHRLWENFNEGDVGGKLRRTIYEMLKYDKYEGI